MNFISLNKPPSGRTSRNASLDQEGPAPVVREDALCSWSGRASPAIGAPLDGPIQHLAELLACGHPGSRHAQSVGQADPVQAGMAEVGQRAGGRARGRQALAGTLYLEDRVGAVVADDGDDVQALPRLQVAKACL